MKAVFLCRSWVCHSRQAQAGGPRCLFGPSLQHTRTWAACHRVSQATAASRFGKNRLLPTEHVLPATQPLQQGRCFANFLHACTHLHMSTQLPWLHPNHQYLGGVTRERLPTSLLAASSVPTVCDPQIRIHHAAELTWSERGYRCPETARGVLPNPIPVLEETPDYRRKDSRSQLFISLTGIWNKTPKEILRWSRLTSLICLFKL